MQFKTESRPMITVYRADVANLRKTMDPDALHKFVSDQVGSHFKGSMLRVDARFLVEDAATSGMSNARLSDIETLLLKMNIYSLVGIHMRLSDSCLDRWLEVPKQGAYRIRLPEGSGITLGFRRNNGEQDERAIYTSTKAFDERGVGAVTHIYIPSTENKEIPIYPCEPFGVKKVDPGSWSQTVSAKVEAEVQSDHAKADPKAIAADLDTKRKAVDDAVSAFEKSQGTILIERDPDDRNAIGKHLKALGFTVEDWSDWTRRALGLTGYLGMPASTRQRWWWNSFPEADPKPTPAEPDANPVTLNLKVDTSETTVVTGSFGKAVTDLAREMQVSNLKAATRTPEVREALFEALCKDGDRGTLTSLFLLSREALFDIEWDEITGKTRKP